MIHHVVIAIETHLIEYGTISSLNSDIDSKRIFVHANQYKKIT